MVGRRPKEATDVALILFVVEQRWKDGEFIDADEVASCIDMVGDAPLPKWLRELACGHLTGELKRPRGRPSVKNEWQERLLPLARIDYHRMLHLLQQRAKRRVAPKKASQLDGPPHEKALELVHQHYKRFGEFRSIDLRRFRDLISSRK